MKKMLAIGMCLSLVFVSCATTTSSLAMQDEEYATGVIQGQADGGSGLSTGWCGSGCLFGPFGILAAAVMPASSPPPATTIALSGKSEKYRLGYTEGYQKASNSKMIRSALVGWLIWLPIGLSLALSAGE
jgi:hypothetical protein